MEHGKMCNCLQASARGGYKSLVLTSHWPKTVKWPCPYSKGVAVLSCAWTERKRHDVCGQISPDVEHTWVSFVLSLSACTVSAYTPPSPCFTWLHSYFFLMLFYSSMEKEVIFLLIETNFWNWFWGARSGPYVYPRICERTREVGNAPPEL